MLVLFIILYKVVLTFKSVDETLGVTIQMKAIEQYFHVTLFSMLYKVALTFKSVDETLLCDYLNESYRAGLSYGAPNYADQGVFQGLRLVCTKSVDRSCRRAPKLEISSILFDSFGIVQFLMSEVESMTILDDTENSFDTRMLVPSLNNNLLTSSAREYWHAIFRRQCQTRSTNSILQPI